MLNRFLIEGLSLSDNYGFDSLTSHQKWGDRFAPVKNPGFRSALKFDSSRLHQTKMRKQTHTERGNLQDQRRFESVDSWAIACRFESYLPRLKMENNQDRRPGSPGKRSAGENQSDSTSVFSANMLR